MQRYNDVEGYNPFQATGETEEDRKTNLAAAVYVQSTSAES